MSNHRNSSKGEQCTTTTVTLCNGALKNVQQLQRKHFEKTNRYLKVPKVVNLLLAYMKINDADMEKILENVFEK